MYSAHLGSAFFTLAAYSLTPRHQMSKHCQPPLSEKRSKATGRESLWVGARLDGGCGSSVRGVVHGRGEEKSGGER